MPDFTQLRPPTLLAPARVSDRSDGKIAHLDGLNLSWAWAMRQIADAMPERSSAILDAAAFTHLPAALDEVVGDYMGEHWLASIGLLALTGRD